LIFNYLNNPTVLIALLFTYTIILLTSFPVHEFAHAWTADRFGDSTPRQNGRLTLNPLAHWDPIGTLMMILIGFGWAKPVPINPYALTRRSAAAPMLVSLAGPASNLLMAIIVAIPFRLGLVSVQDAHLHVGGFIPPLAWILEEFISINLLLMLFNLLPLFPLDGEKILAFFLPPAGVEFLETIRPYSSLILMGLLFILPLAGIDVLGKVLYPALDFLTRLLIGG
jgi:Zn-dependent protease